ncbi:hypothetical protein B0H10DRAFT_492588 [Mycena sp. CBHHK59/15]|nr:hypothetical protein B0H10DRAFT_492588 [Mycena sp. CBHHK59/15]
MPLEITTRIIKTNQLMALALRSDMPSGYSADFGRPQYQIELPYAPIYQWGYGRMDASTPTQGLSTSRVASCISVVLHCPTTGRTVLTHSPNYMMMNTFMPIVDWIIGGDGKTEWSETEQNAWYSGVGTRGPAVVEAVVLRGFDYESERAARYGRDGWMADFRRFLRTVSACRRVATNCVDAPKVLASGAVLVDKTTARITYLTSLKRNTFLIVVNPRLANQYTELQQKQDLFAGGLLNERIPSATVDLHLQYDVSVYGRAMPLPDEGRQLLRLMPTTETEQSRLLRTLRVSTDWVTNPSATGGLVRDLLNLTVSLGRPCELCGDAGHKKCAACKGAWYCGKVHQREDWKAHKAWCKSHPPTNEGK